MSDFDNYIKEKYPQDYENLKLNYPDVEPSEFYPEAIDAWNHQQQKIDELQNKIKELELINFDSELHFEAAKEKIDELQKRIDDALKELELLNYFRTRNSDNAIKILKGEPK